MASRTGVARTPLSVVLSAYTNDSPRNSAMPGTLLSVRVGYGAVAGNRGPVGRTIGFLCACAALVLTVLSVTFAYWPFGLLDFLNPMGWLITFLWAAAYFLLVPDATEKGFAWFMVATWFLLFILASMGLWWALISVSTMLLCFFGAMAFGRDLLRVLRGTGAT